MSGDVDTAELFAVLAGRPDIDAVGARCRGLLAVIRDTLVAELGVRPWLPSGGSVNHSGGRGPFARLGADCEVHRYTSGISPGAVSDADWPRATAIVADLAGRHGFAAPVVVVDRPGDHEVSLPGEYGGELLFGTAVNTTLSLTTGCHLTRQAYLRGPVRVGETTGPAPEPTAQAPSPRPAAPRTSPPRRRRPPQHVNKDFGEDSDEDADDDFDLMNFVRRKT